MIVSFETDLSNVSKNERLFVEMSLLVFNLVEAIGNYKPKPETVNKLKASRQEYVNFLTKDQNKTETAQTIQNNKEKNSDEPKQETVNQTNETNTKKLSSTFTTGSKKKKRFEEVTEVFSGFTNSTCKGFKPKTIFFK